MTLTLQNTTGDRVAFKVKTTSPKKYCVRPSNGLVEPNASKDVQVILQAQREMPANLAGARMRCCYVGKGLDGALRSCWSSVDENTVKDWCWLGCLVTELRASSSRRTPSTRCHPSAHLSHLDNILCRLQG